MTLNRPSRLAISPHKSQQEREGAEEDNPDRGSSSTLVENAKAGEEFQALNTQETASGYVETERANVAAGSSSAVNQHQNPDDLAPERSEQDVTSLTTDEVSSATDDSGKNSGGRTEKEPDVERPKPGSELEQQLMARLLEYESGPAAVKDEAGSEEHAWTIGREWREWLWNAFLFLVVIFAMVIWNVDSSSVRYGDETSEEREMKRTGVVGQKGWKEETKKGRKNKNGRMEKKDREAR